MKNIPQLLTFPLIALTFFLAAACSKGGGKEDPEAVAARNATFDQQLNTLAVDVNIEKFHELLGKPTFEQPHEVTMVTMSVRRHARPRQVEEKFAYTEYLYERDHFYVQAVTDEAGNIGMYSVTAKSKDYFPSLEVGLEKPLQLGKTVYADFSPKARKVAADFSGNPKKPAYYEVLIDGSDDETIIVISTNPLGTVEKIGRLTPEDGDIWVKWFSLAGHDFPLNEEHEAFRKTTVINTYTKTAHWFRGVDNSGDGANFGEAKIHFGPSNVDGGKRD